MANNALKFMCPCKTTVFAVEAAQPVKLIIHGDIKVVCGVCGLERQYATGTGTEISVSEGGSVSVQA